MTGLRQNPALIHFCWGRRGVSFSTILPILFLRSGLTKSLCNFSIWTDLSCTGIGLQECHDPSASRVMHASQGKACGTDEWFLHASSPQEALTAVPGPTLGGGSRAGSRNLRIFQWPRKCDTDSDTPGLAPALVFVALWCQQAPYGFRFPPL